VEILSGLFNNFNLSDFFNNIISYVGFDSPLNIIRAIVDIGIVAYGIYWIIMLVKETRAWQLIKGILFILICAYISGKLGLKTVEYILTNTIQLTAIAVVVLFQPELRRGLEQIGRSQFKYFFNFDEDGTQIVKTAMIEEIVKAATELSKISVGALIVIERSTKIGEIINSGIQLDSIVSSELIINIFTPNTPLHDGALVIRENKIKSAACFLPLTDNPNLSKELGTRHRAALGITEVSDSISVIVSEETGKISFALNGGLTRNLTPDMLRKALNKNLLEKNSPNKKLALWKVKDK
jgi:diadenylate cyclase